MDIALRRVMVFVGSVENCADWYAQHFGFKRLDQNYQPNLWCEVELGPGLTLAFHQAFDQEGPLNEPTGGPLNPHKLVFEVDDVETVREDLIAEGVEMFDICDEGPNVRCDGLDCEEHRFQLVQRRSE